MIAASTRKPVALGSGSFFSPFFSPPSFARSLDRPAFQWAMASVAVSWGTRYDPADPPSSGLPIMPPPDPLVGCWPAWRYDFGVGLFIPSEWIRERSHFVLGIRHFVDRDHQPLQWMVVRHRQSEVRRSRTRIVGPSGLGPGRDRRFTQAQGRLSCFRPCRPGLVPSFLFCVPGTGPAREALRRSPHAASGTP